MLLLDASSWVCYVAGVSDQSDEEKQAAREAILARRRKFVVSTLAGMVVAGVACDSPRVCLKVAAPSPPEAHDAGANLGDGGGNVADGGADDSKPPKASDNDAGQATSSAAADAGTEPTSNSGGHGGVHGQPQPSATTVKPSKPTRPRVCLSMRDLSHNTDKKK